VQTTFDDLGASLADVTFVIVDLETTGGAPKDAGITEIGAVKVRGGERLGTFGTLVNPERSIPPFIAKLTGITDAHVAAAPTVPTALAAFLEFAQGSVLVAHNAPYDIGFLKGACAKFEVVWPTPIVLDTARLARVILQRGEVRNCKLATLAAHVGASTQPVHRALADAEATTDVLHYLIDRVAGFGVTTLPDLRTFGANISVAQRTKRYLAQGLPQQPGVYIFRDAQDSALYVGTSKNIAKRVKSYFTASEQRRRIADMIAIADRVQPLVCATALEAEIREVRLIDELEPRYNRRSRKPDRKPWVKLTAEAAPRLAIVRDPRDDTGEGACYVGPFGSRGAAETVRETLQFAFMLRTCTPKLAQRPRSTTAGCALAELGRCIAPCTRDHDATAYAAVVDEVRATMRGDSRELETVILRRIRSLAEAERFEDAAMWRDRLLTTVRALLRTQQLMMLSGVEQVIAAEQTESGGWDLHCIRFGALAGAVHVARGIDPRPAIDALEAQAAVIPPPVGLLTCTAEETSLINRWMLRPGIRLVRTTVPLALPRHCGGSPAAELAAVQAEMRWPGESQVRPTGPVDARRFSRITLAG
jgi:DNA polymerase-3 subunit epsilon